MGKDIAATGRVVLYSILFDTGKADVKPESDATIAEIAKFLAANTSLKIYVVGHTDNAGTYEASSHASRNRKQSRGLPPSGTRGRGTMPGADIAGL